MRVKLGDIYQISSGGTPKKGNPEYYENGTIPWIKTGDLKGKHIDSFETITELGLRNSSAKLFPENTVLLAMYGATIGNCAILDFEASTNQACAAFLPNDLVSPEYLYYFLLGNKKQFIKDGVGGAQPNISATYLKKVNFELISIEEQIRIVSVLDKLSGIIDIRAKQLQTLDELIKARFVEMFGDIISNSKSWETKPWNCVLCIKNGRNQKVVENPNGFFPICGSSGVMGYANDYITNENSVIIGRKGNINKPILMREKYWNVDTAFGLEPNRDLLNVEYLFLFCEFFDFEVLNKAVTIPSLTKADLLKIDMPLPPIDLQREFAEFVKEVDKSKVVAQKGTQRDTNSIRQSDAAVFRIGNDIMVLLK